MITTRNSILPARRLLFVSLVVGASVSSASVVAFLNAEKELPSVIGIIVSVIAVAALPGYIASAYITRNLHDANMVLAGAINCILYGGLFLWLASWRDRRKRSRLHKD